MAAVVLALRLVAPIDTAQVVEHPGFVAPPVLVEADVSPPAPRAPLPPSGPPSGECDRVGVFTRAELGTCFGPWAGVAWCESSGDSTALNPRDVNGRTSHGLFQFQLATWNATAEHAGRPDLVGVDPRGVPASTQHAMAVHLAEGMGQGLRPWGCGWAFGR